MVEQEQEEGGYVWVAASVAQQRWKILGYGAEDTAHRYYYANAGDKVILKEGERPPEGAAVLDGGGERQVLLQTRQGDDEWVDAAQVIAKPEGTGWTEQDRLEAWRRVNAASYGMRVEEGATPAVYAGDDAAAYEYDRVTGNSIKVLKCRDIVMDEKNKDGIGMKALYEQCKMWWTDWTWNDTLHAVAEVREEGKVKWWTNKAPGACNTNEWLVVAVSAPPSTRRLPVDAGSSSEEEKEETECGSGQEEAQAEASEEGDSSEYEEAWLYERNIKDLRKLCEKHELGQQGRKDQLVDRLFSKGNAEACDSTRGPKYQKRLEEKKKRQKQDSAKKQTKLLQRAATSKPASNAAASGAGAPRKQLAAMEAAAPWAMTLRLM